MIQSRSVIKNTPPVGRLAKVEFLIDGSNCIVGGAQNVGDAYAFCFQPLCRDGYVSHCTAFVGIEDTYAV